MTGFCSFDMVPCRLTLFARMPAVQFALVSSTGVVTVLLKGADKE